MKQIFGVIKLCYTPKSIFIPIPIFAIILFLISNKLTLITVNSFKLLFLGIGVTLFSNFGTNLWNHSNDLEEDRAQGKKNILTQNIVSQKTTMLISFALYLISIILVYYISIKFNKPIIYFFIISCFITWWYSDNILLKKIFGFRLKTHYITELITYGIFYPTYTMSIWLIYSELNIKGIALAIVFLFYGIAGLLLKDLKDISGDRNAGLKTLGVIFLPSKLIQLSCIFLILYYLTIFIFIVLKVFDVMSFLIIIPFLFFLKGTYLHFQKKNWRLDENDYMPLRNMIVSTYISLILFGIGNFI
ncbi:MAG: UbiA family prenyltransferase [Methanosarcinales archaeon]